MTPKSIKLLPEHIIDQIKAGEVIERPSTLLKEIIENSLDAESTLIDIHLIENGLELISIEDNGKGIKPSELPLAFCRHATSKIERFEDVYHLHSFGFRGEALASIASISRLTCDTTRENKRGLIKIEGGETKSHIEEDTANKESSTKIYIKDLFFNTPVRMKFIQSKNSEKNQIQKILNSFILANPQTRFQIKWDEKDKVIYPIRENLISRIQDVLKCDENNIYSKETIYDGVRCQIFITKSSSRGNAHKQQYIFINKRYVQDIQIHKIVLNSAKNLWPEAETGNYVLFLDLAPDEIDVNVHPNKTKIKFFQGPKVFSLISGTINQIYNEINVKSLPQSTAGTYQEDLIKTDKEIQYREFGFESTQQIDNYFDNLHASPSLNLQQSPLTEKKIVYESKKFILIQENDSLNCLHKHAFYNFHFLDLLKDINIKQNIIPLMVSKPIHIDINRAKKNLPFFTELGFEIDFIDNKTALLRSFPKSIQHYSYLSFIADNINLKKLDLDKNINLDFLEKFEMSSNILEEYLSNVSYITLKELNIIKQVDDIFLKKLYE